MVRADEYAREREVRDDRAPERRGADEEERRLSPAVRLRNSILQLLLGPVVALMSLIRFGVGTTDPRHSGRDITSRATQLRERAKGLRRRDLRGDGIRTDGEVREPFILGQHPPRATIIQRAGIYIRTAYICIRTSRRGIAVPRISDSRVNNTAFVHRVTVYDNLYQKKVL